ncbi:phosphoribosylglycinamide formyltransferase [Roseomonas marmotae]|uniref:Phosphoribosylglycinamide formyltransferase n=1 Tax=Roseomonas marmotae TaxID=2768161 RepID=A0ABS3KGG8_9PROT|nr:phosphoribosylglycinamide formyltransferase [Roseomonas marmotae]MBO1076573.1 phosphoribosylglycinamide formyltransferase [Roseomonas marmotae]QTI79560.1 phosphoribosylglycinamide formyltransferase [Roseomonas marmotae]
MAGVSGTRRRTAILISGRGSNMAALLSAAADPAFPAEIVLVLSNKPAAAGLARAAEAGISTAVVESRPFGRDRAGFEVAMEAVMAEHGIELIALAGFMRILTDGFVNRWSGRMVNIHPSLLPAFPGVDTHARALAAGVRLHGCTVHLVTPGVDEGPIIAQAAVPVLPEDTEDSLGGRVLEQEHILYPAALALVAAGRVRVEEGRAVIEAPAPPSATVLRNPG